MNGRSSSALLVPVAALAAGLMFATSAATAQGTDLRGGRRVELTELIRAEQAEVRGQEAVAADLRADVQDATDRVAVQDERVASERAQGDALLETAGLTAVSGPSLTVALDDAPRREPGDAEVAPDDLVVHQQDLQAVVNALWAGGAEAMTLMGQRIVSTSAVRCVGNTVVLHGEVYGPPFVVTAVGDEGGMRTALDREPGVQLYLRFVDDYGLGYELSTSPDQTLPAYDGPLELPAVQAAA